MPKDTALLIPATSHASSTLTGTYSAINPNGLPFGCFALFITNASDKDVQISIDGTNEYEYVITQQRIALYTQTNSGPANQKAYFPAGMIFYAAGTAGSGNIILTGLYQPN